MSGLVNFTTGLKRGSSLAWQTQIGRGGFNVTSGGSGADTLLGSETQGLALDFTDDYFFATTSQYGSAKIIDTSTPANDYDSHPYGKLSYTSASAKMCLGPSGLLRFGAHNLLTYSEQLDNGAWSRIQMSGVDADATVSPDGQTTAEKLVPNTAVSVHAIRNNYSVASGASYTYSVYAKQAEYVRLEMLTNGVTANAGAIFNLSTGSIPATSNATATITSVGNGWYRCGVTFTADTTGSCVFDLRVTTSDSFNVANACDGTSGIYAWGAQLTRTPCDTTYLSTTSSSRYALPYEWNTSGVLQGILVEEARTNLQTYSSTFDNAVWTKENSSVTSGSTTGPDGLSSGWLYKEDATASAARNIYTGVGITVTSSTIYTWSAIVKDNTRRYAALGLGNGITTDYYVVVFDLQTGTVTQANVSTFANTSNRISQLPNGWYKIEITAAANNTIFYPTIKLSNSGTPTVSSFGNIAYNGDNTSSIYLYSAQLEAGSFATSPILTHGSTATRAADNISLATSAFPFSATAGTLYGVGRFSAARSGYQALFEIGDGGANERMLLQSSAAINSSRFAIVDGAALVTDTIDVAGTLAVDTTHKMAGAYASNDAAYSVNGSAVDTDTSVTLPTVNSLRIGNETGGNGPWNGYVRQVMYLPRRMANADLQSLTT